jgi:hypothetical protein
MMLPFKQQKATTEDVEREASRYILHKLGDRLWAGKPVYDESRKQWRVPLHSRSLSADVTLSEMTLDVRGKICHAPSRRDLQRVVQKYLPTQEPS